MSAHTDTTDQIPACPHCDSPDVMRRRTRAGGGEPQAAWYCRDCATAVEAPRWRAKHHNSHSLSGLAKVLDETDPDDVGGGGA